MASVISVTEYRQDGFAIIEDTSGKFIALRDSDDIIPLAFASLRSPCALLQSQNRDRMMT